MNGKIENAFAVKAINRKMTEIGVSLRAEGLEVNGECKTVSRDAKEAEMECRDGVINAKTDNLSNEAI